jgi:LCP family protein required for cell wall assembly
MNFKVKKIRKSIPKRSKPVVPKIVEPNVLDVIEATRGEAKLTKKILKIKIPILISIAIVIVLVIGIVKAVSTINFTTFLKIAGDELVTDEEGHTNFLILGTGDKNHEGADLTDTIIVASLDDENKLVNMLSVPRDLYITDEVVGSSKINEAFHYGRIYHDSEQKGLEYLKEKVEEVTGMDIHYWVKINFQGFKDLVDALGGIDVYVEEAIYDPEYPKDGTVLYETFQISEGQHHLDGETALKYVRSRKSSSDFDRAARQQQVIYAIKEQALQTKTILDQQKVKSLLNALKSNIDTNISVKEILTMGAMAVDYSTDSITQRLIHDNPIDCGGFLYPEVYNEQYVLIPAGGYDIIKRYSDLVFNYPLTAHEDSVIYVLNGTAEYGVAGETKQVLQRYCFDVQGFGNTATKDLTQTTYYYTQMYDGDGEPVDSRPAALDFLQKYIPGEESTNIKEEYKEYFANADILIELGSDYVNTDKYMLDEFYYINSPTHSTNPNVNFNGTAEDPDLETTSDATE